MTHGGRLRRNISIPSELAPTIDLIAKEYGEDGFSGFVTQQAQLWRRIRIREGRRPTKTELEKEALILRRKQREEAIQEMRVLNDLEEAELQELERSAEQDRALEERLATQHRRMTEVLDLIWQRCPQPGAAREEELRDQAKLRKIQYTELLGAARQREKRDRQRQANLRAAPKEASS